MCVFGHRLASIASLCLSKSFQVFKMCELLKSVIFYSNEFLKHNLEANLHNYIHRCI